MEQNEISVAAQASEMLSKRSFAALHKLLCSQNPVDIAALLAELPGDGLNVAFRLLPKELAAETFVEMDSPEQEALIRAFSDTELKAVVNELFADDTVDILEEMPANVVKRILRNADSDLRRDINEILKYPSDSAGSIMTTEFVDLKSTMTVAKALEHIRRTAFDKETVYTCYVIDGNRKLIGVTTVKKLLMSDDSEMIGDIMETHVLYVGTHTDKEDVAKQFDKYGFLALPVVDKECRLVGIVTVDDAIVVMREEATEDFVKMAAIVPTDKSYFETSVFRHASKRIVWLLILMLSATVTGMMLTHYEAAFAALPLLVSFIPMIMDTGGNCGSQSSTVTIRGLATDEFTYKDYFKILFKEERIALICGVILAAVNMLRVLLLHGFNHLNFMVSVVLSITLVITVMVAKGLGCSLPMLAKRIGLDPAIMASPIITTLVDACSIFTYFNIAILVLNLTV